MTSSRSDVLEISPARRARGMATGVNVKIAITFSAKMFSQIEKLAKQHNVSFAQEVRSLCKKGLDDV